MHLLQLMLQLTILAVCIRNRILDLLEVSETSDDSSSAQRKQNHLRHRISISCCPARGCTDDSISSSTHSKNLIFSCSRTSNVSSVAKPIKRSQTYIMFELLMRRHIRLDLQTPTFSSKQLGPIGIQSTMLSGAYA